MMSTFFKKVPLISLFRKRECLMLLSKRPFHGSLLRKDLKLLAPKTLVLLDNQHTRYSTVEDKLPQLTQFPVHVWPKFLKTMKNSFLARFWIKNFYDETFDLNDFASASHEAVEIVSHCISKGDYEGLDGLVTKDVVADVKAGIGGLNSKGLAVKKEDVMFSFPYEINVSSTDDEHSRIVEITMVYHVVYLKEPSDRYETPERLADCIQFLNYRFRRDFKKGVKPEWIINGLNHVQPKAQ